MGADTVDDKEGGSAGAGVVDLVVDLVGKAGDPADLESHIKEGVGRAGLADSADEVESLGADALLIDKDHVGPASTGGDGKGLGGSGGAGRNDAVSVVENVSLDAVALLGLGVVDGVGGAASALAVDIVETRLADAGEGVDVKDLVQSASGSADGQLSVVVLGGGAVGADALDQVESVKTDTNVVDQLLVDGASGGSRNGGGSRRGVGQDAVSVEQLVAGNAEAGEGGQVVGGVGGADITGRADEEEALSAGTAAVLVDLILPAGGSGDGIFDAVAAFEVVADDAHALAEDVVVDLIIGAGDLHGGGTGSLDNVYVVLRAGGDGAGRSITKGAAVLAATAVDVLVGLVLLGVVGAAGDGRALGADRSD